MQKSSPESFQEDWGHGKSLAFGSFEDEAKII